MNETLLANDVVVRYNSETKTVMFMVVSRGVSGPSVRQLHESEWDVSNGVVAITDIGVGVSALLHATFLEEFCSTDQWERLRRKYESRRGETRTLRTVQLQPDPIPDFGACDVDKGVTRLSLS